MSRPKSPVGVFNYRKQYLFSAESIREASDKIGILYVTAYKAYRSRSHRTGNYYIVPLEEIGE